MEATRSVSSGSTWQETVFENSAEPVLVYHAGPADHGRIRRANRAAVELLRCGAGEICGLSVTDLLVPDGPDRAKVLVRGGPAVTAAIRETPAEMAGEPAVVVALRPVENGTGEVDRFPGDDAAALLERVLAASGDGYWEWDVAGGTAFVSRRWCEIAGLEATGNRLSVERLLPLVLPDDPPSAAQALAVVDGTAGGDRYEIEHRCLRPDEREVWIHVRAAVASRDAAGKAIQVSGLITDVTARKHSEEAIHRAALFPEQNPSPVLRVNAGGEVLYANRASSVLLESWNSGAGRQAPPEARQAVQRSLARGAAEEIEVRCSGRDFSFLVVPIASECYANLYGRDVTERRRAEDALRRFELLANHARDIILFIEHEQGRIIEANAAAAAAYGYSREELLGLTIYDLRVPGATALVRQQMAQAEQRTILFQTTHRRKDGSLFPVEVSSQAATIGGRRILMSVVRDITERKLAEYALARSEARFRSALENIPDGAVICDRELNIQYANAAFGRGAAGSAADLTGRRLQDVCSLETFRTWELLLRPAFETKQIRTLDVDVPAPGGGLTSLTIMCVPLPAGEGEVREVLGISHDYTDRRRAERELARAVQRLSAHIDNSPLAVVEFDPQFRVIRWSDEAQRLFGWKPEEVLGRAIDEMRWVYGPEIETVRRLSADLLSGRRSRCVNVNRNYTKDGAVVECEWYSSAIYDSGGRLASILSQVLNVTERSAAERALRESEERHRAALEAADLGTWKCDLEAGTISLDARARSMYGVACETCAMGDVIARIHPLDLAHFEREIRAAGDPCGDGRQACEYRVVHPDNSVHWLSAHAYVQFEGEGGRRRPVRVVGVSADITARRQAEADLRLSEERFRTSVESFPYGFAIYDAQRRYVYMNRLSLDTLGLKWADVSGRRDEELFPEHFTRGYLPALAKAIESGRPQEFDLEAAVRGVVMTLTVQYVPLLDVSGKVRQVLVVAQDITERKRGELALARARNREALLAGVVGRLLASEEPQRIVNEVAQEVMEELDCQFFFNFLVDNKAGRLRLNACAGIGEESVRRIEWLDFGVAVCGCVARDGKRIVAERVQETPDPRTVLIASYGVKAYCCHPLTAGGTVIGTLSFGSRTRSTFSDEDVSLMQAVSHHVSIAMDRMRAQQAVRESEALYRAVARGIPDGAVWVVDRDLRYLVVEGELTTRYGLTREKLEGKRLEEVLDAEVLRVAADGFARALAGEANHYESARFDRVFWNQYAPLRDDRGSVIAAMAITLDITERKQAEEALRESETRFRTLIESIPDLVWTAGGDGRADYFSDRWTAFTGRPVAGLVASGWMSLAHPHDLGGCLDKWRASVAAGSEFETEARLRSADGEWRWMLCRALPLRDSAGRVAKWFGAHSDIDAQKKAAEALKLANRTLERTNNDLRQYAYAASHDLQEPLRMVTSFTQLLARRYRDRLDDEARLYIDYSVEGARRLETLLTDLRDYWEISESRTGADQPVELNGVLREALANLRMAIEEAGAEVVAGELPAVAAAHTPMVQLFQNLLSNAIKYRHPERSPRVEVGAERQGTEWRIRVRDNGIGIAPEYRERVFGLFKRLHARDQYPGNGIGLAICQRIVESHGGRIWVEPGAGDGSAFCFTLPAPVQ